MQEPEKKPNSAYINFVSDNYKSVKAKNPESQSKEVMTLLGAEWKKLGGAAKVRLSLSIEWLPFRFFVVHRCLKQRSQLQVKAARFE